MGDFRSDNKSSVKSEPPEAPVEPDSERQTGEAVSNRGQEAHVPRGLGQSTPARTGGARKKTLALGMRPPTFPKNTLLSNAMGEPLPPPRRTSLPGKVEGFRSTALVENDRAQEVAFSDTDVSKAFATRRPEPPRSASSVPTLDITMETLDSIVPPPKPAGPPSVLRQKGAAAIVANLAARLRLMKGRLAPGPTVMSPRRFRVAAIVVSAVAVSLVAVTITVFAGRGREVDTAPRSEAPSPAPLAKDPLRSSPPPVEPTKRGGRDDTAVEVVSEITGGGRDTVTITLTGLPETAKITVAGEPVSLPIVLPRGEKAVKIEAVSRDGRRAVKRVVPGADKTVYMRLTRDTGQAGRSAARSRRSRR